MESEVVYERDESFAMQTGPFGFEKVGVLFRDGPQCGRVIWLGVLYWPRSDKDGTALEQYRHDEHLAKCLVDAWNKRNNT